MEDRFLQNGEIKYLLEESRLRGNERAKRYPEKKFFGYFCSYWPEELIMAAGMEPFRIMPQEGTQSAPAELPAFCCSLARHGLALFKEGVIGDLAGTGFATSCDAMQCLSGIWESLDKEKKTLIMVPPVMFQAAGAVEYYKSLMKNTLNSLGVIAGSNPGTEELHSAVELCRLVRQKAGELDEIREFLPSQLVAGLLRAGQFMPKADYLEKLTHGLDYLTQEPDLLKGDSKKIRVLVSSAVLESDSLFETIEELGGRVVADDTCTGYRHYWQKDNPGDFAGSSDWDLLVRRYMTMPICPCRNNGLNTRVDSVLKSAQERKAQAAVLVIRKYCDPHAWDAPDISKAFKQVGINTLILELEGSDLGGQERTRLQAFFESLTD